MPGRGLGTSGDQRGERGGWHHQGDESEGEHGAERSGDGGEDLEGLHFNSPGSYRGGWGGVGHRGMKIF